MPPAQLRLAYAIIKFAAYAINVFLVLVPGMVKAVRTVINLCRGKPDPDREG